MTFKKLKEISAPHFHCLFLDKFFPKSLRRFLRKGSAAAALVSFGLSFDSLPLYFGKADGLFFLFVFIYLALSFLEFFYKSMAAEGLQVRIKESLTDKDEHLDFALSDVLFNTDEIDATKAIFESKIGTKIIVRSGILPETFKSFIYSDRSPVMVSALVFENDFVNLSVYLSALTSGDIVALNIWYI